MKFDINTMYDNISKKIKDLSKLFFIIGSIVSVIAGIVMMSFKDIFILFGLLVIAVGVFVSWASSCLVYGFGELIDRTGESQTKLNNKGTEEPKRVHSLHNIDDED